jgi:DNA repair protein RadC
MMEEDKLQERLDELVREFGPNTNPQTQKLAELAKQARESHQKLRKSLDSLQEALDYLRVCIKYQAFDLEATRRENEYLKKILEDRNAKE